MLKNPRVEEKLVNDTILSYPDPDDKNIRQVKINEAFSNFLLNDQCFLVLTFNNHVSFIPSLPFVSD